MDLFHHRSYEQVHVLLADPVLIKRVDAVAGDVQASAVSGTRQREQLAGAVENMSSRHRVLRKRQPDVSLASGPSCQLLAGSAEIDREGNRHFSA